MALEVGPKAIADNVRPEIVDNPRQLVDLRLGQELCFVDEKPVDESAVVAVKLSGEGIEVGVAEYPAAFAFYAYARAYYAVAFACVGGGFHAHIAHAALFEIVGGGKQQGGFGRPHGAVSEI